MVSFNTRCREKGGKEQASVKKGKRLPEPIEGLLSTTSTTQHPLSEPELLLLSRNPARTETLVPTEQKAFHVLAEPSPKRTQEPQWCMHSLKTHPLSIPLAAQTPTGWIEGIQPQLGRIQLHFIEAPSAVPNQDHTKTRLRNTTASLKRLAVRFPRCVQWFVPPLATAPPAANTICASASLLSLPSAAERSISPP